MVFPGVLLSWLALVSGIRTHHWALGLWPGVAHIAVVMDYDVSYHSSFYSVLIEVAAVLLYA